MSEAPRSDYDSRPGEDQPASSGQEAPGGDSYALYRRGLELLGRGSPAAAAQVLERVAEAEPGARSVLEALARAQFDSGRYTQAADSFRQIVEASPSDDYAHFGLGLALARAGNPAAAAEHLALAAAMRPELRHYTEALRSVRATLQARAAAGPSAAPAGPAGPADPPGDAENPAYAGPASRADTGPAVGGGPASHAPPAGPADTARPADIDPAASGGLAGRAETAAKAEPTSTEQA